MFDKIAVQMAEVAAQCELKNAQNQHGLKLSITLDTFPTRIMKQSGRWQPLRRIFAALQQEESRRWPSRSCGCSSNS